MQQVNYASPVYRHCEQQITSPDPEGELEGRQVTVLTGAVKKETFQTSSKELHDNLVTAQKVVDCTREAIPRSANTIYQN